MTFRLRVRWLTNSAIRAAVFCGTFSAVKKVPSTSTCRSGPGYTSHKSRMQLRNIHTPASAGKWHRTGSQVRGGEFSPHPWRVFFSTFCLTCQNMVTFMRKLVAIYVTLPLCSRYRPKLLAFLSRLLQPASNS